MANVHVLDFSGRTIRTVMHFPTPAGTNAAGKTYAECIVEAATLETGAPPATILPASHLLGDPTEASNVQSGALLEQVVAVASNDALPLAVKRAHVDAEYTRRAELIGAELAHRFRFWGLARTVP